MARANWLTRGAWDGNAVVCAIKSPSITYIALQWNANGSLKRLFSQSALWYGCNAKNILLPECILLPSDTKNRDGWNTQLFVSLMICWLWPGICVKYFLLFLQKMNCHQKKLRQSKCLLLNFWMIKFTVIPKKCHLELDNLAKLVFLSILSFKNWKVKT